MNLSHLRTIYYSLFITITSCILVPRHEHAGLYSSFCAYSWASSFTDQLLIQPLCLPTKLPSYVQTRSWCVPFNCNPSGISWTLLKAYPTTMFKINDDKAPHRFTAFWIRNASHKHLTMQNLTVSFKYPLISLNSFMSTPISSMCCTFRPSCDVISFLVAYK
jgi:hypothetical protein